MDFHRIFTASYLHIKPYLPMITISGVGLMLIIYGLISLLANSPNSDGVTFVPADTSSGLQDSKIVVDVAGSVLKPGVYSLPSDARVKDAIVAAGGLSENADRTWVAKNINLAAKLTDGAKMYIPEINDQGISQEGSNLVLGSGSSQININAAGQSELESLPGIGPVTAQKIIQGRPYSETKDLLVKKIVGEKVFSQIENKIRVY